MIKNKCQSIWDLLQAGNEYIGLNKIGDQYLDKIEDGYKFDNNAKIVFEVQEDINKARQLFIDKNIPMREVKTFDNYAYWLCDGEDPEGNVFQLKQKKSKMTITIQTNSIKKRTIHRKSLY